MSIHRTLARLTAIGLLLIGAAANAAAQSAPARVLKLTFEADGTVSLEAANVAVRDILAEWARQCGCYVVNADRMSAAPIPVPVQFPHANQATVLQSLLRSASGYVLTPRRAGSTAPSNYETIYIVPTSAALNTPSPFAAPVTPVVGVQPVTPGSPDDEIPPVQPVTGPSRILPDPQNAQQPQQPQQPGGGIQRAPAGVSGVPLPIVPIGSAPPPPSSAPGRPTPAPAPQQQPPQSPILPAR